MEEEGLYWQAACLIWSSDIFTTQRSDAEAELDTSDSKWARTATEYLWVGDQLTLTPLIASLNIAMEQTVFT